MNISMVFANDGESQKRYLTIINDITFLSQLV